jgi:hypothetical protein
MADGFMGKVLWVNLSEAKIQEEVQCLVKVLYRKPIAGFKFGFT